MPKVRNQHGRRSFSRRSGLAIALGAACWFKFGAVVAAQSFHHHQPHPYGHAFLPTTRSAVQVPFPEQLEPQPSLAQPLNQLGRILGIGYSDGYHAAPPRPTRYHEDLPPQQSLQWTGPSHSIEHDNQTPHCEGLPPDWITPHAPQPLPPVTRFAEPSLDENHALDESVLDAPSPSDLLPPASLAPPRRSLSPPTDPPTGRPLPTPMPPDRIAPQPINPQPPVTGPSERLPAPDSKPSDRVGPDASNQLAPLGSQAPNVPTQNAIPNAPSRPNISPYAPPSPLETGQPSPGNDPPPNPEQLPGASDQPPANDPLDGSLLPDGKDPYRNLPSDPLQDFRPASARLYIPAARPTNLLPRPRRLPAIRPRPTF